MESCFGVGDTSTKIECSTSGLTLDLYTNSGTCENTPETSNTYKWGNCKKYKGSYYAIFNSATTMAASTIASVSLAVAAAQF